MDIQPDVSIRLMGPLQVSRGDRTLAVPASRKARAILGYLVMSPRPVTRQRLCDLFFDLPDDPRASLRWTLTKLRALVDDPDAPRIVTNRDLVSFSAAGARVDVLDLLRTGAGADMQDMTGAFLEDAELPERQDFTLWLQAARDEVRGAGAARLRERLAAPGLAAERRLGIARQLHAMQPLDETACVAIIRELTQMGRLDEAREMLAEAERSFRRAGMTAPPALRMAMETREAAAVPPRRAPDIGRPLVDMLPCVAIAPFQNYSPEALSNDLIEGFVDSLVHMVSRFRFLRVLSVVDIKGVSAEDAEAGVDYVVGGSIMLRGDVLKLRYRIVDARTSALLASGDLDGPALTPAAMIEDLPDALTPIVMHSCLDLARARAQSVPESERTPVEDYLYGMHCAYFMARPDFAAAHRAFQAAVDKRSDYAAAMAAAAHCKSLMQTKNESVRREAETQARTAIALGPNDAFVLSMGAWSLVRTARDIDAALQAADLAIRVNPAARLPWVVNGWIRAMMGEVEKPLEYWEIGEKRSPLGGNLDMIFAGRAFCFWMAERYEDALAWAKRSLERVPDNPGALTAGVAAAYMLNDAREVRQMSDRLLHQYPEGADAPALNDVPILVDKKREAILAAMRRGLVMAAEDN